MSFLDTYAPSLSAKNLAKLFCMHFHMHMHMLAFFFKRTCTKKKWRRIPARLSGVSKTLMLSLK